jgi:large subunit ribosomal protein L1
MAKLSKRVKEMKAKVDRNKVYAFDNAVSIVKEFATAKFNESIDVAVQLGVDPKKSDQVVRGETLGACRLGNRSRKSTVATTYSCQ